MLSRRLKKRAFLSVLLAAHATLLGGCESPLVLRSPGYSGTVVDRETGRPIWQATISRLGSPEEFKAGAGTNAVWPILRRGQTGPAQTYSSRDGRFHLHPAYTFSPLVLVPGLHRARPDLVAADFTIEAPGYAHVVGAASALADQHGETNLGTIKLSPLSSSAPAGATGQPEGRPD